MCLTLEAAALVGFVGGGGDTEMHQGGDQSGVPHGAVQEDAVFSMIGRRCSDRNRIGRVHGRRSLRDSTE